MVVVLTGILDKAEDDAEILGLIFHEPEHAVKVHDIDDYEHANLHFYKLVDHTEEPLGFLQANDPAVESIVAPYYITNGERVGAFPDEVFMGLPFMSGVNYRHPFGLGMVYELAASSSAATYPSCAGATAQREEWKVVAFESTLPETSVLDPDPVV